MSKESFKPEESGYTPEEMSKMQRSRLLSDAEAVAGGVKMTPEGKLDFTEEQIKQTTRKDRIAYTKKEIREHCVEWLKECSKNPDTVDKFVEALNSGFGLMGFDNFFYESGIRSEYYNTKELENAAKALEQAFDQARKDFYDNLDVDALKEKHPELVDRNSINKTEVFNVLLGIPDQPSYSTSYLVDGAIKRRMLDFAEKFRKSPEVVEQETKQRKKAELEKEIEDKRKELGDLN